MDAERKPSCDQSKRSEQLRFVQPFQKARVIKEVSWVAVVWQSMLLSLPIFLSGLLIKDPHEIAEGIAATFIQNQYMGQGIQKWTK